MKGETAGFFGLGIGSGAVQLPLWVIGPGRTGHDTDTGFTGPIRQIRGSDWFGNGG